MIEGQVVESDFRVPQGSSGFLRVPWKQCPIHGLRFHSMIFAQMLECKVAE